MKKNNFLSKFKEQSKKLYNKNKKLFVLTICLCVLLLVVFVSSFFSFSSSSGTEVESSSNVTVSEYAEALETKLENMIGKLDLVTSISVLVMVDSTPTITYLTDTEESTVTNSSGTSTTTLTTTVVFEKNGSISTPIAIATISPKVTGVLVVVNKIDSLTKLNIISSISTVLNVDSSCISILQES